MAYPTENEMLNALEKRIGKQLLSKFQSARVAVCGLGGLGSNISISLARAGIGNLHIIDFDKVDISNLNRQQYFASQLGIYKTEAMLHNLKEIAPYCKIKTDCIKINAENVKGLLENDDIICEAFDNPECKAMLVNNVIEKLPEKYIVSASGMAGIASANEIRTRRITKHFYICGDGVSDVSEDNSLFSSRVMACAAHQAHTVLRIIAGCHE